MTRGPRSAVALTGHPRGLVEATLERVLQSTVFRRSDRHRRFMRHVVQAALDGRGEVLKEVLIGLDLFDRRLDDYDPRRDPIVRVEAGRIRAKLTRYYLSEGSGEQYGFDIPTGGYVPTFERRDPSRLPQAVVETYAVMPFATRSGDDEAFTIGLADQLINLLGRARDLRVVARVSVQEARERDLDLRDVAKLLKVTRVVDGSFQRHGGRMRCIAHIYRGADATRLWSQTFDSADLATSSGQPVDPFTFQDHVAEGIASAALPTINGTFSPLRSDHAEPAARDDVPTALQSASRRLLDQATYLYRRFDTATCDKVIDLVEEASRLDPLSAPCQRLVALARFQKVTLNMAPGSEQRPMVEAALARALALDPADTDALALDAMIAFRFAYDWPRAERLFQEALKISPHAIEIHYRYAFCLIAVGRYDEGYRHLQTAIDLDPLNFAVRASAAQLIGYGGDVENAKARLRALLELEPHHLFTNVALALVHLYDADWQAALARFDRVIALYPDHLFAYFGRIASLGYGDRADVAADELDALVARLGDRYYPRYGLAIALVGLGRRAAACAALERAAVDRDTTFCTVGADPLFAPCRQDSDFIALLSRHGLGPTA